MAVLPVRTLPSPLSGYQQFMNTMKDAVKCGEARDNEEVVGPRDSVMSLTDIRVRVVPGPEQMFGVQDV